MSDEQKLKKKIKCGGCEIQIPQYARSRSGYIGERKYCTTCWSSRRKEKRKLNTDNNGKPNNVDSKADEASAVFTMAFEVSGHVVKRGAKRVRKSNTAREEFMGVEVSRSSRGCTLIVENHIFTNMVGWIQREAWKQPML